MNIKAYSVRAKLQNNSKTAVLGVGGLGHLAIRFLHKMGYEVSAFSHSPGKKEIIDKLGAEYVDSNMMNMLAFSAKHSIESIVDVLPFSKMNEAIELVRTGKASMRLVLENRK